MSHPTPRPLLAAALVLASPVLALAAEASPGTSHGWGSILPPLIAVVLALITRQVLPSLFVAVFLGATMAVGGDPVQGFIGTTSKYAVTAIADADHAAIILFSMALAGMVGVMSRSGGSQGIVETIAPYARTPKRAQLATWVMGLIIFFDDYANSLLVGTTMRPLIDRMKISREKLAYIVDSTAAPVAGLAAISTWVGFEVGLIQDAFAELGRDQSAYLIFLETIPLRFYSIFCLGFVVAVCLWGRDFGPMLQAERRARAGHGADGPVGEVHSENPKLDPDPDKPKRWQYALMPVLFIFVGTGIGLWLNGSVALEGSIQKKVLAELSAGGVVPEASRVAAEVAARLAKTGVNDVLGEASAATVLLCVSFLGSFLAMALPCIGGVLTMREALEAWVEGAKAMVEALMILVLAWSLGHVCKDLGTAGVLAAKLKDVVDPFMMPALTFVASAAISFATGSSWGTMSILMPISIPLAVQLAAGVASAAGAPGSEAFAAAEAPVLLGTIGAILAGSCFGDHCSPISDTTILSSMASGCDHVEHVRTQMPYALVPGVAAIVLGHIPAAHGVPVWVCLGVGMVCCLGILRIAGRPVDEEDPGLSPL